ncbi:MAG: hypothetical protein E6H07_12830 [Bacteroidetes bacterium]|nr:MAG: hypothetical protein E6H07_12830 [Bacteroidota bacterium]
MAENFDKEETHIPGMILQPFVENSIKHGIHEKNDGLVKITVSKNGSLPCVVEDNCIGRKGAQFLKIQADQEYDSKGMEITINRIETFNKIYEASIVLNIEDLTNNKGESTGTKVKIDFPVDL